MQTLHNKGRRQKGIKLLYGNKQTIRAQESVKRDTVQSRTWKIGKKRHFIPQKRHHHNKRMNKIHCKWHIRMSCLSHQFPQRGISQINSTKK